MNNQPSQSYEETGRNMLGAESEMHDLCFQQIHLFPFRMKLIVKFFSFEPWHPVYSILYKVSFFRFIAHNVEIIHQLHLLLLGNHNENKNTSPRRFHVSGHWWCDRDVPILYEGYSLLCKSLFTRGMFPWTLAFQNLCYKNAQYIYTPIYTSILILWDLLLLHSF